MSDLQNVSDAGVSIWLDDLSRDRLQSGSLQKLIDGSSVVGVTTNPSIFSAAISGSTLYRDDILALKAEGRNASEIVTELTTSDVRQACDLFMPTFLESHQVDGRVSIEVDPQLAYDTTATVERGLYLASLVNRPNLLIKVPATIEGLPAIEELTAQGISVNVTLIFSVDRYRGVMDAYLRGLERRLGNGASLENIHSVASFFVSRIDTEIDKQLDAISANSPLRGAAAIANAHLAYEAFLEVIAYDSTRYVIELIAANCVNTMPEGTLNEVREHGVVRGDTITSKINDAKKIFDQLPGAGIDFKQVVTFLEDDGVAKFEKAWLELLANVEAVA